MSKLEDIKRRLEEELGNFPGSEIRKPIEEVAKEILKKSKTLQRKPIKDSEVLEEPTNKGGFVTMLVAQIIAHYAMTHNYKRTGEEFHVHPNSVRNYVQDNPRLYKKFERIKTASIASTLADIAKKAGAEMVKRLTTMPEAVKTYELNVVMGTALDKMWRLEGKPDKIIKFEKIEDIKDILDEIEEQFANESEFIDREEAEIEGISIIEASEDEPHGL